MRIAERKYQQQQQQIKKFPILLFSHVFGIKKKKKQKLKLNVLVVAVGFVVVCCILRHVALKYY